MSKRNENRPGYKKTKVGWIPIEWEALHLKFLCPEKSGIKTGPFGSQLHASDYVESGIPVIMPTNMSNGRVEKKNIAMVSENTARRIKSQSCKNGDILFARRGELGRCALIKETEDGYLNGTGCLRVRLQITKADPSFMVEYFSTSYIKNWLERNAVGQTMLNLNTEILSTIPVAVPSLTEQKKIAEILSTWDAAIEQTRKLIDAKKRRKKALMQQLLTGKKRLPGFAKTIDRDFYRFFDLPSDWKCSRIRGIARECSERNTQRAKLTVLSCSKHFGFVNSSEYFGKQIFSEDTSNYKIIRRCCFGYPSNHIEEGSIGLLLNHDIGIVSPIYTVFKCDDRMVPEYLYALFKTDTYRHIFSISTNASVDRRGSLRWREFSLIQVPNPSKEEQHAIVDVLQAADNEINQLEKKLKALEKQKRGLMQKLLTGEIRVK